jgi:hypothetical protein
MDNKSLFSSDKGSKLISVLLGLALSSILFQFKCKNNCVIHQLNIDNSDKIYNYDNKCYKFIKNYI